MWQKIIKKSQRYLYKRYLLVLVLFMLAFVFGKNMNVLSPQQQQLQDQADAQKKITSGIYDVTVDQNHSEIKNIFIVKNGQCGRLIFSLRNIPVSDSPSDSQKIKVLLSNDFDQNQEIGSYKLMNDQFFQNEEADFCADSDYQNLLFVKDEANQKSSFEISDLAFYPLAMSKNNFNDLVPSINGNSDFSKIIFSNGSDPKYATAIFKFTRSNQMIGQTFVASANTISGVDLKMEFTGVGGIGNYSLELREINDQNGRVQLLPDRIGYFYFDKKNADKNLKIENGIYHIPLAAHMEIGKSYFIGVSNQSVDFNVLNTLNIYYNAANDGSGKMTSFVKGKSSEIADGLYIKVYGVEYQKFNGEKILTGARILDNGDGYGLYIYKQKGNFSDYLDLEQAVVKDDKKYNIFYDSVYSGVSAKAEDGNSLIYKINTIYPFSEMKIEAEQPSGTFIDSLVYFSFDSENWQEMNVNAIVSGTSGGQNKFEKIIQGNVKYRTVYVKVTCDKDKISGQSVQYFGLKNLKVVAKLKIK